MNAPQFLSYLSDADGHIIAVQIPLGIWTQIEPLALSALSALSVVPDEAPEPLQAFEDFLKYWDFRYPYSPAVSCPHCGASTADWRADVSHPFRLINASFGGLLVFHCKLCHTTIRQKHFRDHVALEHTVCVGK